MINSKTDSLSPLINCKPHIAAQKTTQSCLAELKNQEDS